MLIIALVRMPYLAALIFESLLTYIKVRMNLHWRSSSNNQWNYTVIESEIQEPIIGWSGSISRLKQTQVDLFVIALGNILITSKGLIVLPHKPAHIVAH